MCHTISMEEAHHQNGGGYAVGTCHIINTEDSVQYRAAKTAQGVVGGCIYLGNMIFYRQFYHSPDLILLWLNPDVAEIP